MGQQSPTQLLFVCRHGAAKSVLAAEIANRRAAELGLLIRARARGLVPEPGYAPQLEAAVPGLLASRDGPPEAVTAEDLAEATIVVTFDLEPAELPGSTSPTRWDGLPAVSEDPLGARRAIEERVARLIVGRSSD